MIPDVWSKDHLHENPLGYSLKKEISGPPQIPCIRITVSLFVVLKYAFHGLITFPFEEEQQCKLVIQLCSGLGAHILRANFLSLGLVTTSEGLFARVPGSSLVSRAGSGRRGLQGDQKVGEVMPVEPEKVGARST